MPVHLIDTVFRVVYCFLKRAAEYNRLVLQYAKSIVIESLENRRLFAGITVSHLVMHVTGNPSISNTITVGLSPDQTSVDATISWPTKKGPKTISQSFAIADQVGYLIIKGGSHPDMIVVDQTYGSFQISTQINGGAGRDTIYGGDERDLIYARGGNEYVDSGAGNDSIKASGGKDTLLAGLGDDRIDVNKGKNYINGGDGNDTLRANSGHDTLLGGAGNDKFVVVMMKKHPLNDYDTSIDTLKKITPADNGSSFLDDWLNGLTWPF